MSLAAELLRRRRAVTAIEVKSGRRREMPAGVADIAHEFPSPRTLLVGGDGISLQEFLARPVTHWV